MDATTRADVSAAGAMEIRKEILRQLKEFSACKQRYFPVGLCRDRNLEILLGLYEAHLDSTLMTSKLLAKIADLELGMALRRLHALEECGLIERSVDAEDRRRITLLLSEDGRDSVERFIDSLLPPNSEADEPR